MTRRAKKPYVHTVKTIALFAALVISFALPAGAQGKGGFSFRFSTELFAGLMQGGGVELVYGASSGAEFLSRLNWDIRPLYYYGAALNLALDSPAFSPFARLTVKSGINGNTGFMEDRDWQDDDQTYLTDFSRHDNYTSGALFVEGDLGLGIRPFTRFRSLTLDFLFRVYWSKVSWEARDGYYQHNKVDGIPSAPAWDPDQPRIPVSGAVIDYSQEWLLLAPGFGFDLSFLKSFSLGASLSLSPLIWGAARDYHFRSRDKSSYDEYEDYPEGGFYLKPEWRLSFSPSAWVALSFRGSWTLLRGSRGFSRRRRAGSTIWEDLGNSSGGAGLETWDFALGIKIGA
ncbi:MAG: omptin family outer membrane protease [Spirochaetaceae bacterium]|nr:omptin family outer membrane protease [Spirochaetaceae bacterium]